MVDYVSDAGELLRRLRAFAFGPDVPEAIAERLQTLPGSNADVITTAPEIMYAHFDLLPESGARVMAEIFVHGNEMSWTTFAGGSKGTGNRAELIVSAVARELGDEPGEAPHPDDWPAPDVALRAQVDWRDLIEVPEA